jgi:serine acetyltransferase
VKKMSERNTIQEDIKRWYPAINDFAGKFAVTKCFIKRREFRPVYIYRKLHSHRTKKHNLRHKLWTMLSYFSNQSIYIDENAEIGPGMQIIHPFGISVGAAHIGRNFTIHQNASVGANYKADENGEIYPKIGDNVRLSPCSHILGPVIIGSNVLVAANAVIIKDCPGNCVMGGLPAKVIGEYDAKRFDT